LPNGFGQFGIRQAFGSPGSRRHLLGDDTITVDHEHRLAARREPDILAQLVLEGLDPDGARCVAGTGVLMSPRHAVRVVMDGPRSLGASMSDEVTR
jgi:hypothetical protein